MTFNIHHGRGLDGKVDLDRIATIVSENAVDIVGLNEVDKEFSKRSSFTDQSKWLSEVLKMDYVFGPAISIRFGQGGPRQYGNALLSRYPIASCRNEIFRFRPYVCEPRGILETEIPIKNLTLKVLTSHFSHNHFLHRKQLHYCIEKVCSNQPMIIMGDLNRTNRSRSYKKLATTYTNCSNSKPLNTFPAKRPRIRLDYIFVNEHFEVLDCDVIQTVASDHLPVVARIKLKN